MCGYSARQAGMILELLRSGRIIGPDFPDASGRHERGGENGRRGAGHGQSHRRAYLLRISSPSRPAGASCW